MNTNKPGERALRAAEIIYMDSDKDWRINIHSNPGTAINSVAIIIERETGVEELREAADNAIPRLIELTRVYKENHGTAHTQDFDEAINKLKKALRLGEG